MKVKRPTGIPGYDDARIIGKNVDGSYKVEYNDGRIDSKVLANRIAIPPPKESNEESKGGDSEVTRVYRNF